MHLPRQALYLGALLAITACKSEPKNDALAQDSTLTRDLALANRDSPVRPQLNDVPLNTTPATPARKAPPTVVPRPHQAPPPPRPGAEAPPTPPAPLPQVTTPSGNVVQTPQSGVGNSEGEVGTIAAGTSLVLAAGQQVCTNTNHVGDRFTATLSDAMTASNGTVLPAGSTAVLEVTGLKQSQQAGDNMSIGLVVRSISYAGKSYPVNGSITSAQTQKVRAADNHDAAKVVGGAAVGAILGRIFSGKSKTKGTVLGAAGGAAAGAVVASQTAKYDACIPSGGRITVRLDQAMQIQSVGRAGGGNGI